MARRENADVLRKARKVFDTAKLGLADLQGNDPARRIPGLHNLIAFGRATTFVLQNLRTIDETAFDAWYEPYQTEMRADPLMRYFNKLRTELEKEGGADTGVSMQIGYLNFDDLAPLLADAPAGAQGFFMGDTSGGSGWNVLLPDGSPAKYYVQLPESIQIDTTLQLADPPSEHLGNKVEDQSAPGLARLYLVYIERLLAEAEGRFGSQVGVESG